MTTIRELKDQADHALFSDQPGIALALYVRIVAAQPANLDARLRIADSLLALGAVQEAAVVYTALARHATLAGHPLRALIALKMLSAIEPKLGVLLNEIAALYGRDSQRLGRSVRRALPDLGEAAPDVAPATRAGAELVAYAQNVAANYDTAGFIYPDKLMPIPLFSLLDAQQFGVVLSTLRLVRARPGSAIVREGEPGQSFFVLARGQASVTSERSGSNTQLALLDEGAIFGEMALLTAAPRSANITAKSDCDLLEFDCSALADASSTLGSLAEALSGFARERLLRNVVSTSPLFGPLDPKQRGDLMRRFVGMDCPADSLIVQQGDVGQGLYVVLRGEVVVSHAEAGGEREIARLGSSEIFGEISLLHSDSTTASVRAGAHAATLLFLSRDYFERLLAAVPELRAYLERMSEGRLMDLHRNSVVEPLPRIEMGNEIDDEIEVDVTL